MDTITLVGPDGLSLTVPDSFTEVREQETAQLPLVAVVDPADGLGESPGDGRGGFHPMISVRVDALAPELATVAQLSDVTIARQIALDRHVVAVDVFMVDGQEDGRSVTSLYPRYGTTILELQYLTVRAGRAVTLSVLIKASTVGPGVALLRYLMGTLRCGGEGPSSPESEPVPVPVPVPVPDAHAAARGLELEPLGDFGPRQPFVSACPPLGPDDLAALKGANLSRRRRGRDALIGAGLIDPDGRLTGSGVVARDLLRGAQARLTAGLTEAGGEGTRMFHAPATGSDVVVLADAPPGRPSPGQTLDVVAGLTLGARLVRWLGLAPAWTYGIGDGNDLTVRCDPAAWKARMADPDAPAPDDAPAGLIRLWEQPWQLATVRTTTKFKNGPGFAQFLKTPEAGYAVMYHDSASRSVVLKARPSGQLLNDLLVVSGVASPRGAQRSESSLAGLRAALAPRPDPDSGNP